MRIAAFGIKALGSTLRSRIFVAPVIGDGPAQAGSSLSASPHPGPRARASELSVKIELFMQTQRPTLSITLAGGLYGHADLERIGPRRVAVRLAGWNKKWSRQELQALRQALTARGLELAQLSVDGCLQSSRR